MLLAKSLPQWGKDSDGRSTVDFYYWHYGTLAMFQMGGENWKNWNSHMKRAILDKQCQEGCEKGSWPPVDPWGTVGGRVSATALNILSLEVYYRYVKVFR